jgi:methionine-rich copper-binding protein CopC
LFVGIIQQLILRRLIMKILSLLSGPVLVMLGVTASAHAHLQKSSPADNSVITASPSNLVLDFSEAARLTALSIQKGSESPQKLNLPTTAAQQISVPLPQLTPGTYSVSWRVLSDDGHMMSGVLHFTLAADHATDHPG